MGKIDAGLDTKLDQLYKHPTLDRITNLLADTIVSQASVYADAHYVTIVDKTKVDDVQYSYVSGFVSEQKERCYQHLRLLHRKAANACPSSTVMRHRRE